MNFFKSSFLILLLTVILSSCIGIKREIKLNSNGSGTEKMTITINKKNILALQSVLSSLGNDTDSNNEDVAEMNSLFNDTLYLADIRDSFKKLEVKDSMNLISVKEAISTDSLKTVEIVYDFKKVKFLLSDKAAVNLNNDSTENINKSQPNAKLITKNNQREFIYTLGKQNDDEPIPSNDSVNVDGILKAIFGQSRFEIQVEVPGDIISTNANVVNGKTAMWDYPMSALLNKIRELKVKFKK